MMRHKTDESLDPIHITVSDNSDGGLDWIGLPQSLKMQLTVFSEEEIKRYPGTLL